MATPYCERTRPSEFPPFLSILPLMSSYHLFSLFLLRPRVRLSPFMASFPPSLFLFSPLSAHVSSRCFARYIPFLSFNPLSLLLRQPPPFQFDSLAANPLSVVRWQSLCMFHSCSLLSYFLVCRSFDERSCCFEFLPTASFTRASIFEARPKTMFLRESERLLYSNVIIVTRF